MKTTSNFLAVFMFAVSAFGFVSCSDDNNGGGSTSGEFFEITIDEKTTTTIYNQQNDFFAKIKTKRPKSDKIAKRNGCQKLKHTSIKKAQRTQSKLVAFFAF